MIPAGALIGLFLLAVWAVHHPALATLAVLGLALLVTGLVKFCREVAPRLAVASWPPLPSRACAACGSPA